MSAADGVVGALMAVLVALLVFAMVMAMRHPETTTITIPACPIAPKLVTEVTR